MTDNDLAEYGGAQAPISEMPPFYEHRIALARRGIDIEREIAGSEAWRLILAAAAEFEQDLMRQLVLVNPNDVEANMGLRIEARACAMLPGFIGKLIQSGKNAELEILDAEATEQDDESHID